MKVLFIYYSCTGNTKLVSEFARRWLEDRGFEVEFVDIMRFQGAENVAEYDLVGFSFPVFVWAPPDLVTDFLKKIPRQKEKPAFFLYTHGGTPGGTPFIFDKALRTRGFQTVVRHSVQATTSHPLARTLLFFITPFTDKCPGLRQKRKLDDFLEDLTEICRTIDNGRKPSEVRIRNNFYNPLSLIAQVTGPRFFSWWSGCPQYVDMTECNLCRKCEKVCPVGCVTVTDDEVQFGDNCTSCYSCYNNCPKDAISSTRVKGHYYKGPSDEIKKLFGSNPES